MIDVLSREVYNSMFNVTEENNKFEIYRDTFDELSFDELKDELEEILNISDITPSRLQHEKKGPRIVEAKKKIRSEKSSTDGYVILLTGASISRFWKLS